MKRIIFVREPRRYNTDFVPKKPRQEFERSLPLWTEHATSAPTKVCLGSYGYLKLTGMALQQMNPSWTFAYEPSLNNSGRKMPDDLEAAIAKVHTVIESHETLCTTLVLVLDAELLTSFFRRFTKLGFDSNHSLKPGEALVIDVSEPTRFTRCCAS